MPTRCSQCGAVLPGEAPGEERAPCPACGSTRRTHEGAATATARASASVSASVERGLNDTRLAVLGIIVAIGLTVGSGVQAAWYLRVIAGVGAVSLAALLIRWPASRRRLMALMHWLTRQ